MKKNIFPISIIIVILLASSFLFWKGELVMKEASENYTIFYFENTQNNSTRNVEDLENVLDFSIENNKTKPVTYGISFFIDEQEILRKSIRIKSNEIIKIDPPTEVISKIQELKKDSFNYQIKTDKTKAGFELTKKIFFE